MLGRSFQLVMFAEVFNILWMREVFFLCIYIRTTM